MHRRAVLRLALAIPAGVIAGLMSGRVHAQGADVTSEMVYDKPWLDLNEYTKLARLAAALIDLRIVYNGPNGYEAEPRFADGAFDFLGQVVGASYAEGWQTAVNVVQKQLDASLSDSLSSEMNRLLEKNGKQFIDWLGELGIQTQSGLQHDFLRAQAFFAVMASVILGGGKPSTFSEFTWIHPFC